ncbi:MAG: type II toxin-antitoxin system VapC family toxin [Planctomycetes bacterium]|nr:type II toxin-antitoxin system VapC family toxin [Planctomycetota bacterium]
MIALDTNILVRYLVRDDARQAAASTKLIESGCTPEEPGFVSQVVLAELSWVLDSVYGYGRADIQRALLGILSTRSFTVEDPEIAWRALNEYQDGKADFADYLIGLAGKTAGAEATVTFDRSASGSGLFLFLKS